VVDLFAAVSNGNARPVLEGLAPRFEHFFLGDHALGGSRFTLQKTRLWYERLYRLLPDISFDLRAIRISGPPWNTLVAVDWLESNSGTDGVRTFTPGVHVVVGQDDGKVPTFSRNRDGRLAGIVSIGDVVKHRLAEIALESNALREELLSRTEGYEPG